MANKSQLLVAVIVISLLLSGCVTHKRHESPFQIGSTVVRAVINQRGNPSPTFVNVHDDENTSVIAGMAVLRKSSGRIIELSHSGRRLVTFTMDGVEFRFDPNRIFSDEGVRATLSRRGGNYSEAAHRLVKDFANEFITRFKLDDEPAIIALHNTGGRGLSINSYSTDGGLNSTSAMIHVGKKRDAGDFFYVTDRRFFDYLSARDFNVTLQDNARITDDGSLSVYFARKGIPYMNIEADTAHLTEQTEMIRVARQMLKDLSLLKNR